ncbi:MAG: efflux RND transporter periplasmic adaptor subunit, partial [Acidobacteriota bacterium]
IAAVGSVVHLRNTPSKSPVAAETKPAPLVAVDLTQPARTTLRRTVEVFGSLSPKTATEIKSELPGRIVAVRVKEWDSVKPKDELLEIDPEDIKISVNRCESGLNMAKAQLLQTTAELNAAKREWNRAMKLKEGGLITGQELDSKKTELELAEAKVSVARAQVGQAESLVAEARHNLTKMKIYAPIDGTISSRKVDIGEWVDKGALLFSIVDNRVLDFTANVPATDLAQIAEGQTLLFTVDGLPNRTFQGRIKRVNPTVSSSDRSGRILAEVRNEDSTLRGGLFARGQVVVEERKDVVVLAKAALMNWDIVKGAARIFVVDEAGTARAKEVSTGLVGDDVVEITSGLSEGEKVVLRGGFNLREGDRVRESEQREK